MRTIVDDLFDAAARELQCYLATRHEGFRQQAWDRLRELGINLNGIEPSAAGAVFLLNHLSTMGVGSR